MNEPAIAKPFDHSRSCKLDVLSNRDCLENYAVDIAEAGVMADLILVARENPVEAAHMLTALVDGLADLHVERIKQTAEAKFDGNWVYGDWIEQDMELQQSQINLEAYKAQLQGG